MHSRRVTVSVRDLIIDLYHTTINHILPHFVLPQAHINMFMCTVIPLITNMPCRWKDTSDVCATNFYSELRYILHVKIHKDMV